MSTLANITSLNLTMQTGGAALAVKAAGRLVAPARTVYVYGTADDVAPNFTTVAGAITYANSLTPIVTEPVVIRLFTKADGTPYDLAGLSSWTTYANSYIYFVSDFVRLNETTTLPTTLPEGLTVWYRDGNDVEYLYVGNADGDAQLVSGGTTIETGATAPLYANPALSDGSFKVFRDQGNRGYLFQGNANSVGKPLVGYGEFMARVSQTGTGDLTTRVFVNTLGVQTKFGRSGAGFYTLALFSSPSSELAITANDIFFPGQNMGFAVYEASSATTTPIAFYKLQVGNSSGLPRIELLFYDAANDASDDISAIIGTGSIDIHFIYIPSSTY